MHEGQPCHLRFTEHLSAVPLRMAQGWGSGPGFRPAATSLPQWGSVPWLLGGSGEEVNVKALAQGLPVAAFGTRSASAFLTSLSSATSISFVEDAGVSSHYPQSVARTAATDFKQKSEPVPP